MSKDNTFSRPSFRHLAIGLVVGAVVYVLAIFLVAGFPAIANILSIPLLILPSQLGLVETVEQDDVIEITVPSENELVLPEGGSYQIYSDNLLPTEDGILIKSQETNRQVKSPYILDGINVYGDEIVEGVPIQDFEIESGGIYEIYLQKLPPNSMPEYKLYVVPDYSSHNRLILFLSCLVHLVIIGAIGWLIHYWRNKERLQQEKLAKAEKRARFEEWMDKQKA